LILYHGVLAVNAAWRKRVVAYGRSGAASSKVDHPVTDLPQPKRKQWTDLMRRAFGYDLLSCPNCGGKMQLLACIMERGAIRKILAHLGLPPDPSALERARASPDAWEQFDTTACTAPLDARCGDVRPKC
jgi:hypothetical protein